MVEEELQEVDDEKETAEDQSETGEEQTEPAGPPNIVTVEDAGPCKKKVSIEIPEEKIRTAADKQYDDLRREAVVPGFRKGRAPRRLLEKRFGKETREQVKLTLLAEASDQAFKDQDLDILGEPDVDFENIELPAEGPLKFDFEVEVRPEFELPALEGIPVTRTKLEVTDEQIDREIEQLQKRAGLWTPRDEDAAVELGDQIIADAILKIEGVEEDTKLDNIEVYVRPSGVVGTVPVERLDEWLVGAKSGDVRKTSVDVPKTYFREELRGKNVEIELTVKDVKWLKPAEIDEAFLERCGVKNERQFREEIRDMLQSQVEAQIKREMTEQIYKQLLDNTEFDLPLDIVAKQAGTLLQRQYVNLLMRGLPRETIEEQIEQLRASSEGQAKQQLKTFFIMDQVAEKLEIEVTDEEVNGHIAQLAAARNQRPERLRETMERDGSLAQFKLEVRQDKCISKLLETAQITEREPEKKPKKAKKAAKRPTRKKKTGTAAKKETEKKD